MGVNKASHPRAIAWVERDRLLSKSCVTTLTLSGDNLV